VPGVALDKSGRPYGENGIKVKDVSDESGKGNINLDLEGMNEVEKTELLAKEFEDLFKHMDEATNSRQAFDEAVPGHSRINAPTISDTMLDTDFDADISEQMAQVLNTEK
jgi:hypothetical protein